MYGSLNLLKIHLYWGTLLKYLENNSQKASFPTPPPSLYYLSSNLIFPASFANFLFTYKCCVAWMPVPHRAEPPRPPLPLCSSSWVLGAPVKSFQHLPPPRLCISIIVVPASLGIWLIGKLELAEEVEDNAQVFYLNKHTLQFILLDFVLWMRTPQVILLQTRNCLLTPDYKPQNVLLCLWKHISL